MCADADMCRIFRDHALHADRCIPVWQNHRMVVHSLDFFNIFAACQLRCRRCAGIFKNLFCDTKSRLSAILHDQHMLTETVDLIAAVRHHQNVFVITGQKF